MVHVKEILMFSDEGVMTACMVDPFEVIKQDIYHVIHAGSLYIQCPPSDMGKQMINETRLAWYGVCYNNERTIEEAQHLAH